MSLTQYPKSQENQDITRLLNFTKTQERRREGIFLYALEWRRGGGGGYIVVVKEI